MHKKFMISALEQAWKGRGRCAPNPSVGAVAVQNDKIIAQAYHDGAGTAHAERLLLSQLPKNIPDLVLYVTLEPCNHWGKTPPCVDIIAEYGVKRVVYGYQDPNPIVAKQNTPEILASKGIDVVYFPLDEIHQFYRSYTYWTLTNMPWVTVKIAQSLDARIGFESGPMSLSNQECAVFTHHKRATSDVILTTARTIKADNPQLNARLESGTMAKEVAILDRALITDAKSNVFSCAKSVHIYYDEAQSHPADHVTCNYYPTQVIGGCLNLHAVIKHLGALGYHDVWVEAGGTLFAALHQTGLVQQTYLYLVPQFLGTKALSGYNHVDLYQQANKVEWQPMGDNMIVSLDWQHEAKASICLPG